jgi:hypothetical protein
VSLSVEAPTNQRLNSSCETFADQIADLTKREVDGVSSDTMELIIQVATEKEPLVMVSRRDVRLTAEEFVTITDEMVTFLGQVYERSGRSKQVGIELTAFAIRRLGYKFKPLCELVRTLDAHHVGTKKIVLAMISTQVIVESPHYQVARR